MNTGKIKLVALIFLLNAFFLNAGVNDGWKNYYNSDKLPYTSMSLIEKLNKNVSGINPEVDQDNIQYLYSSSCLGSLGPSGAYGPLGLLGPLGDNSWNVELWNSFMPWKLINDKSLSPDGPLGVNGPVSKNIYEKGILFENNNFAVHTRAFGLWTDLGAIGPFGALGPLGPLGTLGDYGSKRDAETGQYIESDGTVDRNVKVKYPDGIYHSFELYEDYNQLFAENMSDNDTSFMVDGVFDNNKNSYEFTSNADQIITILALPLAQYETVSLNLTLSTSSGNTLISSNSDDFINFIQVEVKRNTKMKVDIIPTWTSWSNKYRLFVVGSSNYINSSNISGDYIKFYEE